MITESHPGGCEGDEHGRECSSHAGVEPVVRETPVTARGLDDQAGGVVARIAAYAEQAHLDTLEVLIEAWADVQTERLVREILDRPRPFLRVA